MKTIALSAATAPLGEYARDVRKGPLVLTKKGRPVAALVPIDRLNYESFVLSTDPDFIALIERSRARHRAKGGTTSEEVRRTIGIRDKPKAPIKHKSA